MIIISELDSWYKTLSDFFCLPMNDLKNQLSSITSSLVRSFCYCLKLSKSIIMDINFLSRYMKNVCFTLSKEKHLFVLWTIISNKHLFYLKRKQF